MAKLIVCLFDAPAPNSLAAARFLRIINRKGVLELDQIALIGCIFCKKRAIMSVFMGAVRSEPAQLRGLGLISLLWWVAFQVSPHHTVTTCFDAFGG